MDVSRTCPCGANTQFQTISFFEESADAAGPLVRSDLFFEERSLDVSCQMAGAVSKRGRLVYSLMLLCAFCGAGCQSGKLLGGFWNSKAEHPEMLADAQSQMTVEEHLAAGDREFTLHQANPAELAKSRSHYESVVQKSPEHVVAHHRLAIIADLQKQYSVAEAHYRTALKGAPQNPDLLHDAGYSLVLQGRSAEAKPYFERALALSPQYVDAAEKLALIHLKAGNTAAASQVLAQAMPQPQVQQTLARLSAAPAAAVEPEQTLIGRIKNNLEHLRPGSRDKQEPDLTQQVVAQVEQARRDAQLQQGQGIQQTAMQSYQPDPWGGRHESRLAPDGVSERGVHPSELAQHIANIDRDGQSRPSRPIVIDAQGNPTQMSQNSSHRGIDPWADQREHSRSNGPIYIDGPDQPQPRTTSQNPSQLSQGQYQSQYSPQNPYQPTGPQPSPIQEGTHLQGLVDREHPGQYQAGPYQPGQGPPVHDHQSTSTGYNDVLRRMELVRGDSSMGRGGVSRGGVQWPEATAEGGGDRRFIPGGAGATSASTGSGQFAEIIRGSERGVAGPIPSRFAPRSQQAGEGVDRNTSIAQWPQGSGAGDIQPAGGLVPGGLSEQGYDSTNRQSVPSHNEMRPSTPYYHDQQAQQSFATSLPANPAPAGYRSGGTPNYGVTQGNSPVQNEAYRAAAAAAMGTGPGQMFPVLKQVERTSPGSNSHLNGGQFASPSRYLPTDQRPLDTSNPGSWNGGVNGAPEQYSPGSRFGTQSNFRSPPMSAPPVNQLSSYDTQRAQFDAQMNARLQQSQGTMPANFIPTPSAGIATQRPTGFQAPVPMTGPPPMALPSANSIPSQGGLGGQGTGSQIEPDFPTPGQFSNIPSANMTPSATPQYGSQQSVGTYNDYSQGRGQQISQPEPYPYSGANHRPSNSSPMTTSDSGYDPPAMRPAGQPQRQLPPAQYAHGVEVPESYFNRSPASGPNAYSGQYAPAGQTTERPVIIPGT